MSTVDARRRALRGAKRTCAACEVRFYDLGRDRIVCPMCGADYALPAEPAVAPARAASFANRTGWHRQPVLLAKDAARAGATAGTAGRA